MGPAALWLTLCFACAGLWGRLVTGRAAHQRIALAAPKVPIIDVLPVWKPGSAAGVMHGFGETLRGLLVPALKPVPLDRQRADVAVVDPLHPVQKGTALAIDHLGGKAAHRGVIAVE